MTMNRQQRRQAAKEFQAQLKDPALAGAVDLAERAQAPKRVYMGYLTDQLVTAEFLRSLLAVGARSSQFGYAVRPVDVEVGSERPKALNLLLKSFLEGEDDYLLFAETNIAFAPQDVAMLIAADAPIAGALYFTAASGAEPWPTAWVEGDIAEEEASEATGVSRQLDPIYEPVPLPKPPEDLLPTYEVTEDMTDEEKAEQARRKDAAEAWMAELSMPIPVAGVGFGLALVSRETAEFMAGAYEFPFEAVKDRREDLTFCLRAGENGHKTVVVPAARVANMRSRML
jgi:hypothetical protein